MDQALFDREQLLRRAAKPAAEAMRLHPLYRGKVQILPKCPISGLDDFSVWYTPGVAASCRAIHNHPDLVYEHTNKGNCIAIVSDGTRVLGLGDIGPEAGLPVMEGKALLFKYLGGVDAVPLCLNAKEPTDIIRIVQAFAPSFGGINLEDIQQPKCFRILDALRETMPIPVWHDDQQGTATVVLAGLSNALNVVGKDMSSIKIAMVGVGAANIATYRLLKANGIDPGAIVACDSAGTLHRGRCDIEKRRVDFVDKWQICVESNAENVTGGILEALRGADVCIAFSAPGIIPPQAVRGMAKDAIVFACANPDPEIWPWDAEQAGARIVTTGRCDLPNQLNNALAFPGIFRGVLDVQARTISDEMALAAAHALSDYATEKGLRRDYVLPRIDEWDVAARVAAAVGMKAQAQGLARVTKSKTQLLQAALSTINTARKALAVLMDNGVILPPPA
jgi:malate dehydrogenase (oxaloacetate-decarboxylating)